MNNKVWTYAIGRELSDTELQGLLADGQRFASQWTAHENQLAASFDIQKSRLVVVKVNEDVNNASGCSIDKLTRFMKEMGSKYSFDPMNRLLVALKKDGQVDVVHSSKIKELLQQQAITESTIVYNTAVASEDEFARWEQPLKDTWLSKYLS